MAQQNTDAVDERVTLRHRLTGTEEYVGEARQCRSQT